MSDVDRRGEDPLGPHTQVDIGRVAELFGLMSDQTRAGILYALLEAGELSLAELAAWTGVPANRSAEAIRVLRTARVVTSRKSSDSVLYSLGGDQVRRLLEVAARAAATRRLWLLRNLDAGSRPA
jgi:DNA-binding transcriptional ArsR family regulator